RSRTCNLILRTDLLYPVELPRRSWKATLYSTTGNTGTYRALACILFVWHLIRIELIVAKPVRDFLLCLFSVTCCVYQVCDTCCLAVSVLKAPVTEVTTNCATCSGFWFCSTNPFAHKSHSLCPPEHHGNDWPLGHHFQCDIECL